MLESDTLVILVLNFKTLTLALNRRGYRVERDTFDCGETITVYIAGDGRREMIVSATRECGDIESATEYVATFMLTRGLLTLQDFG